MQPHAHRSWLLTSLLVRAAQAAVPRATQPAPQLRWFKGNTHTHTTESDGDSPPEDVTRWYRERGYNFLVLSDHNVLHRVSTN